MKCLFATVASLPMRDGNKAYVVPYAWFEPVASLPMRDGNRCFERQVTRRAASRVYL